MTPREVDVAFVLESVEGVRAVHALEKGTAARYFDFAVELESERRTHAVAAAHYSLLRVLSVEDAARVFYFHVAAPNVVAAGARLLRLTSAEREQARQRVPPPPKWQIEAPAPARSRSAAVLVVGEDDQVEAVVREAIEPPSTYEVATDVPRAVSLAAGGRFGLILCDAQMAFGEQGLLRRLPLDVASGVVVLARQEEVVDARWRLQGMERVLVKPLEAWVLRQRIARAEAVNLLWEPDLERITRAEPPRRKLRAPDTPAPFRAFLVDVEEEIHDALRAIFFGPARHVMRPGTDFDAAAEEALSTPFHLIVCSTRAVFHRRSFLDAIAREDPTGANRVLVVAHARDVPWTRYKLDGMGRANRGLALPIDDTLLREVVFGAHPELAAVVAIEDVAGAELSRPSRLRFRRLQVLVVDEDVTTQILFSATGSYEGADVVLATTPMEAFEHVASHPVDVIIVSATMRADGGEPFYRLLWRLQPALKSRCMLAIAPGAAPASSPPSALRRVVERPLTRDALACAIEAFGGR